MDLRSTHTDENRCGRVIFDGASAASRRICIFRKMATPQLRVNVQRISDSPHSSMVNPKFVEEQLHIFRLRLAKKPAKLRSR